MPIFRRVGSVLAVVLLFTTDAGAQTVDPQAAARFLSGRGVGPMRPACDCCELGGCTCPSSCTVSLLKAPISIPKGAESIQPASAVPACPLPASPTGLSQRMMQLRSEFAQNADMLACNEASIALLGRRTATFLEGLWNQNFPRGSQDDVVARGYAAACLKRSVQMFGSDLTPTEEAQMTDRVAIIVDENDRPRCHGYRIGDHIVTAKHCTRPSTAGWPSAWRVRILQPSTSSRSFKAQEVRLSNFTVDLDEQTNLDFSMLRLEGYPRNNDDPAALLGRPRQSEPLLLPQSNAYRRYALGLISAAALRESVTIQSNPVCYARAVTDNGYIFHPCQTEQVTSGAPILQRGDGGLIRLVGVHAGATSRAIGAHGQCERIVPNHGVVLPVDELVQVIRRGR